LAGPAPEAGLAVSDLTHTVEPNSPPLVLPLTITNSGGLPLAYSLSLTGLNSVAYNSSDSTQAAGPFPVWKDISVVGNDITADFTQLAAPKTARDEGIAGPFNLGFDFPFFSGAQLPGVYSDFYVSPNGFIAFAPFAGDTSANLTFPVATNNAPSNCVAWFWDDLDLSSEGRVYWLSDPVAAECTVQFQNLLVKGTSATVSGQVILNASGEILLTYQTLGRTNTCTVGVQNGARSNGYTAAFNQNCLQSDFAVRLTPTPWLGLAAHAGYVPPSSSETVNVTLDPTAVAADTYSGTLVVRTGDPVTSVETIPVSLNILAAPSSLVLVSNDWNHVALAWQDNSPNETGFELERRIGSNGVFTLFASLPAAATNLADTNVSSRTTYGYRLRAFNAGGASAYTGELLLSTPAAPIELWRLAQFGTMDNIGVAADGADPDNDRLVNLVEYAFGLEPNTPSLSPVTYAFTGGHLVLTYTRPRPAPVDVRYVVEVTEDLLSAEWNAGPACTSETVKDNEDGTETVTVTDLAGPPSPPAHYLRLSVAN